MSTQVDLEKRRNELFELNTKAWNGDGNVFSVKGKLDTSLKKNTAFIKKVRLGITKENEKQLMDGIQTTSLEKYINEISSALCESLCKVSKTADIQCAIEVVSGLHQRFRETFTPYIELFFVHSMCYPSEKLSKKDEKETQVKIRNLLKLAMEFYLCGIFRTIDDMPVSELPKYLFKLKAANKDDIPIIVPMLKEVMGYDFISGVSLPVILSFLKRFGDMIYDQSNPRYEEQYSTFIRKLMKSYIKNAVSSTETYFKSISNKKQTAHIIALKTGKTVADMEENIEELETTFNEFKNFCDYSCPLFEIPPPELKVELEKEESTTVTVHQQATPKQNTIWENDETKKFYTDIPDLESLVSKEILETINAKILPHEAKGSKFAELILRLDNSETADDVDNVVKDFWDWGLSNKASRNRLSKHIVELRDVTKFRNIARFLKINEAYFEKCIEDLITRLDKSFRFQMHHDSIAERDILLFSELVKFKLIPIHIIFHKVRVLILNIEVNNNIDLLSLLFDACGKMLLYDEEYKDYTKGLIQLLLKVYKTKKFSHTDKYAVKVFLLSLNPPKINTEQIVEIPKEEKFLLYLIKTQLGKNTCDIIGNTFKLADWDNPSIYKRIVNILSKCADINFINIPYLAKIFKSLCVPHSFTLKTQVLDQLIEDITIGLEENDIQLSRSRISQVIYFIHIINLKIISESNLIPLLYKIVCFGHSENNPTRENVCELDPPDDHFRIRLVSSMLLELDVSKLEIATINNLIIFVKFFNYYVFTKMGPLAIDLNSKLDTALLHLNSSLNSNQFYRPKSYEESIMLLQQEFTKLDENDLIRNNKKVEKSTISTDINDVNSSDDDDFEDIDDVDDLSNDTSVNNLLNMDDKIYNGTDDSSDGGEESESDSDASSDSDSEDDEDEEENSDGEENDEVEGTHEIVSDDVEEEEENDEEENDIEQRSKAFFEAELDLEFEKLMYESMQNPTSNKLNKGILSDSIGTPGDILYNLNKNKESPDTMIETDDLNSSIGDKGGVKFTFLSRSGKKIQQQNITVPETSHLAINVRREQDRIRFEKDKIKNLVLNSVNR